MRYNLKCSDKLQVPKAKTSYLEIDKSQIYGEKVWETLPAELKRSDSLQVLNRIIKTHKCHAYNCRLCRIFYPNLGFLL